MCIRDSDKTTALTCAQAISAALFARERDPKKSGTDIDLSMLDAGLAFLWPDGMMNDTFLGDGITPMPPLSDIYQIDETKDGHITYIVVSDAEWSGLCKALKITHLTRDPKFNDIVNRLKNISELKGILRAEMSKWSTKEICERLDKEDVPFAKINTIKEVIEDPQIKQNGAIVEHSHPIAGKLQFPKHPVHFENKTLEVRLHAPDLGQHTAEVLRELNFCKSDVDDLFKEGVVN